MVFSGERKVKEGWLIFITQKRGMAEIINSFPMVEIILFTVL